MAKKRFRSTVAFCFPELHRYDTMILSLSSTPRQVYLIIPFFFFVSFLLYFILHPAIYLYFIMASIFRTTFINLCQILSSYGSVFQDMTPCCLMERYHYFCRNLTPPDSGWNCKSISLKEAILFTLFSLLALVHSKPVSNLTIIHFHHFPIFELLLHLSGLSSHRRWSNK